MPGTVSCERGIRLLVEVVVDVDVAESHARRALPDVGPPVVVLGDAVLAAVLQAGVATSR